LSVNVAGGGPANRATLNVSSLEAVTMRARHSLGGVAHQPRQVCDALRYHEAANRTHDLSTVGAVDPRAHQMGRKETGEKHEQGLAKQASWKQALHSLVTAGANI
jgi:hypothetical protein